MTGVRRGVAVLGAAAAVLTASLRAPAAPASAPPSTPASAQASAQAAAPKRVYVTPAAAALVEKGLAAAAPGAAEAAAFTDVPAPGVRFLPNVARATNVPWIDSNGWRFARGVRKASYATLPAGSAALAAAEAFVFDVDAVLNPDPKDVEELGRMLAFLADLRQPPMPERVNIGVVDDRSPLMGEVLNLLTRRNLLYKVVTAPDRTLDLTVQLGTPDFPMEAAANPYTFAARVRAKLGDDARLVRLYGTGTVLARLTSDGTRTRLFLLAFDRRRQQSAGSQAIRARVRGRYKPTTFAAYGAAADAVLSDLRHPGDATEFWVPSFNICAIVDLDVAR